MAVSITAGDRPLVGESRWLSAEDDVSDMESGFRVPLRTPWPSAPLGARLSRSCRSFSVSV